jgi:tetratricopeptide (TPR) repeat protein
LIGLVAAITYATKPANPKLPPPGPPASRLGTILAVVLVPLALLAVLIIIAYVKAYDPLVSRALKRSREGDREGAIEMLREGIESGRATGARLNNLGVLYSENKDYAAALKQFQDAEKVGGRQAIFLLNQVDALRNLGRPTEAAALLEEVQGQGVIELFRAHHSCLILADLGEVDEAREVLRHAEGVRMPRLFTKANREARSKMILECRDRLEGKPRDMTRDDPAIQRG